MPDLRQGCTTGKPSEDTAPADALVLFGAMGDLAHKKIFPALYHMVRHGHLDVPVIGVARAARTDEHLKERVRDSIQQQGGDIDQEALAKLLKLLRYIGGDYEKPGTFDLLQKTLGSTSRPAHYLAIPPSLFTIFVEFLANANCKKSASHCRKTLWTRSCLGAAVECRSSCRASRIENFSYRPLPR